MLDYSVRSENNSEFSFCKKYLEKLFSDSFWDIWISVQKLPLYSSAKLFSLYFPSLIFQFYVSFKKAAEESNDLQITK